MTKVLTFKDCSLPEPTIPGILQARILEWVVISSLLQGIFTTQGLNPGLLHCRQILYHLSPQGSLNFFPYMFTHIHMYTYSYLFDHAIHWSGNYFFFSLKTVSCLFFCISTSNSILDIKVQRPAGKQSADEFCLTWATSSVWKKMELEYFFLVTSVLLPTSCTQLIII